MTNTDLNTSSLTNHFLIAMPGLQDPNFSHTVTYICEHNEEGAMGLVVNSALDMHFDEVLSQMGIDDLADIGRMEVLSGGPVQVGRGFVLHSPDREWPSTLKVSDQIWLTASRDILESMAEGQGPKHSLVLLGYAGWEAGQLERELSENAWLTIPADTRVLFEAATDQRWQAAAECVGVDLNLIPTTAGHA